MTSRQEKKDQETALTIHPIIKRGINPFKALFRRDLNLNI